MSPLVSSKSMLITLQLSPFSYHFLFQSLFNQQESRVLLTCVPWTAMILVSKDQMTVKTCQELLPYNGFKKKVSNTISQPNVLLSVEDDWPFHFAWWPRTAWYITGSKTLPSNRKRGGVMFNCHHPLNWQI